mgnify:CR=1 FL=1
MTLLGESGEKTNILTSSSVFLFLQRSEISRSRDKINIHNIFTSVQKKTEFLDRSSIYLDSLPIFCPIVVVFKALISRSRDKMLRPKAGTFPGYYVEVDEERIHRETVGSLSLYFDAISGENPLKGYR